MVEFEIQVGDGTRLHARWREVDDARAVLVIVHGYSEHSERYLHVYEAMARRGVACLGFDLRGHGHSTGRRGHVRRFADYLDDVAAAVARARGLSAEPLFVVGHSFGGLIAALFAMRATDEITGLTLSSPAFEFAVWVPAWKRAIGRLAARVWPTLTMPAGIDPATLSRDPEVGRRVERDPLTVRGASARWYAESLAAQRWAFANAGGLTMPTLLLHAGDDVLVSPAASRRWFAAIGAGDKQLVSFDDWRHELFQDPERERAFDALAEWVLARAESESRP